MNQATILKQVADLLSSFSNNSKQPTQPVRPSAPAVHQSAPPVRHDPRAWQQAKSSVVHIFDHNLASQRIPLSYAGLTKTRVGPAHSFRLSGFDQVEVIVAPSLTYPFQPRIVFARGLSAASSSFYINNQLHNQPHQR